MKGLPEYHERCVSTYILHAVRSAGGDLPNMLWQTQTCASTCSTATLPALVDAKCWFLMFLRFAGRWFSKAIWLVEESGKVTGAEASGIPTRPQPATDFGQGCPTYLTSSRIPHQHSRARSSSRGHSSSPGNPAFQPRRRAALRRGLEGLHGKWGSGWYPHLS